MFKKILIGGVALVTLLSFSACTTKSSNSMDSAVPAQSTPIDPATTASISGTVTFSGAAPSPVKIDMSQDPACGNQPAFDESVIVTNSDLANVFIYIKDGLGNRSFALPAKPVTIQQKGCRYQPHVLGALTGQTIRIVNDDNTSHNIHPHPQTSRQWNESQPPQGTPIDTKFDHPEILIPVQCNQHPWMHMYLGIVSNPFFAVTGKDGKFEIHGLPPGTYTLAAVHERLGERDLKITVGPKESKTVDFNFSAPQSGSANLGW